MTLAVDLSAGVEFAPRNVVEEVIQNVRMLLSVWRGSVPLDRELGIDADLLDAPIGVAQNRLASDLARQIADCEPRARLKSLEMNVSALDGRVEPKAIIVIEEELA